MAKEETRNAKDLKEERGRSNNNRSNRRGKPSNYSRDNKRGESGSNRTRGSQAVQNILVSSASIAPRTIAGTKVTYPHAAANMSGMVISNNGYTIPGVYSFRFVPTFGYADGSQTNAVNISARNVWMNLRSLYSNKIPYTAGAITLYALGLDSILCFFQMIKRLYGICFAFDARNKYVADGIMLALGIDAADFRANLPDVKVFINRWATMLSAFGVPTELKFITEHVDLCSHVYLDGASSNAQYLVTTPHKLWKLDWTNNKCVGVDTPSGPQNWGIWAALGTTLIESFLNYEDVYMIASDMLRLYGSLQTVGPVDDGFSIGPEYSEEFLNEIHNASYCTLTGKDASNDPWEVTELQTVQNVGALTAKYSTGIYIAQSTSATLSTGAVVPGFVLTPFDFHTADPSMEQTLRAADWKFILRHNEASAANKYKVQVLSCGTKMLQLIQTVRFRDGTGPSGEVIRELELLTLDINTGIGGTSIGGYSGLINGFKYVVPVTDFPMIPDLLATIGIASNVLTIQVQGYEMIFGNTDMYFSVDTDDLSRIHEAIILDLFDAAGVGTLNLKAK